jgi:hypothetical protein
MFSDYKVFGPYSRPDGRQHVILEHKVSKLKKTMSYPKYLYQLFNNVILKQEDTIDHQDRDYENNSKSNLILRPRAEHCRLDAIHVESVILECKWCGIAFKRRGNTQDANSKKLKAGPFCGRSCAGKYGKSVQLGAETLPPALRVLKQDRVYFYLEKHPSGEIGSTQRS